MNKQIKGFKHIKYNQWYHDDRDHNVSWVKQNRQHFIVGTSFNLKWGGGVSRKDSIILFHRDPYFVVKRWPNKHGDADLSIMHALADKLEKLWPCCFLAAEWPKGAPVVLTCHENPEGAKNGKR